MDLTFLGTASSQPSLTRNHSATALRYNGDIYLFDCGEATQHQFIRTNLKISKVRYIFITHLHGDHSFGLPGFLCTLSATISSLVTETPGKPASQGPTVTLYGPRGLRTYVRNAMLSTYSQPSYHRQRSTRFVVHELWANGEQQEQEQASPLPDASVSKDDNFSGDNILARSDGTWMLLRDDALGVTVKAAPMCHTVPCVGYSLREHDGPGRLKVEELRPLIEAQADAIRASGVAQPLRLLSEVKAGKKVTLPDGTVLEAERFVEEPKRGRHVVVLGDTSDSSQIAKLARGCTVLVHEATNACLEDDLKNGATPESVEQLTKEHGHSTPELAGHFAKDVDAQRLILTHFSNRYKGDEAPESMRVMDDIRALAVKAFGKDDVLTARDLMTVAIQRPVS
ncbi:Metallo-hydrolase/oxidoreductase [Gonapodya prolifera JEL478]|uniref:Metallo-hydrolase/oxidoreductase n=1 Tax=Gonapodya prolifera (strain JEL478) TaxID=1344416 RepID=A0A139AGV7_GONPJ|nr:Metallo-hydrolase/oxidoreductase [Gonapodya prolifera JEL478]|eukprot:KXS15794.1 Metallo-hydrolase/oxidoreductase [Gonapodya prolifera JEL478]